ncbi:MAG: flagellar basal body-associated FliL family protein [Rhodoferax sp.]|nr:flagellar basal body-associated FliL family protein [Rhodoferax sp.]
MSDAAAAPEAEAKPKKPIVLIIGGVVALVVLVAGTMVGTLFITGFFNKPVPTADQMVAEGADGGHGAPAADGHGAPKGDGHGAPAAGGHGEKKAEGGHGEKKAEGGKEGGPPKLNKKSPDSPRFEYTYSQLEREFLVNLAGSRKVMSVQIAVMTRYDDRVVENIKKHEFALRSVVMDAMRMTSEADLSKPDFRKDLAIKIRDAMNTLLEKYEDFGGIEEIYFTSFIVQ